MRGAAPRSYFAQNAPTAQARYHVIEPRAGASEFIGEGAYGVVYKALDRLTNKMVALKKLKIESDASNSDGISSSTLREITLLMQLNHENVVKLENVSMDRDRMSLIFELLEMDLRMFFESSPAMLSIELIQVILGYILRIRF